MFAAVRADAPRSRSTSASGTGGADGAAAGRAAAAVRPGRRGRGPCSGGGAGRGAAPGLRGRAAGRAGLGWPGSRPADPAGPAAGAARPGWAGRGAGRAAESGPAAGGPPRPAGAVRGPGGGVASLRLAPDGWPVRPAPRWPVRPPPRAGSSRRRSSTTPCPPSPDRPGSAGTARPRAIRWDRSRCRLALAAPSRRRGRWLARWVSRTLAAAPEARRTSPSSDGCLADHSPPLRLPGATTPVSGASFMLCQENGPGHAVTASSRRDPSGRSGTG